MFVSCLARASENNNAQTTPLCARHFKYSPLFLSVPRIVRTHADSCLTDMEEGSERSSLNLSITMVSGDLSQDRRHSPEGQQEWKPLTCRCFIHRARELCAHYWLSTLLSRLRSFRLRTTCRPSTTSWSHVQQLGSRSCFSAVQQELRCGVASSRPEVGCFLNLAFCNLSGHQIFSSRTSRSAATGV